MHTQCCVVGGGPAGMMLGLLLARAGVRVTVLEKHGDFLRDFRGDTVHPSTMGLLDDLGLGEQFAALHQSRLDEVAFPVDEEQHLLRVADFSRLARFGVRHPYVAMVPQWDLLTLLADAAAQEPGFTLRMRSEVVDVLRADAPDGATTRETRVTGVRIRTADGRLEELGADLVVACDGRTSILRDATGLPVVDFPVPMDAWWFRLPRHPDETAAALTPRTGHRRFGIVIPREGYFQIAYLGRKGTDPELRARGLAAFRADVAELLPGLADRVDAITDLDEVRFLDVRVNRLRRWHVDGLLCIGDAAHAMSPVGGVGINLAIQDAVATARLLAGPLLRGRVTPALLARVRRRRLLPTVLVQGLQRAMHRGAIDPVLLGRRTGPPAVVRRATAVFPGLTVIPALALGIGVRPERAPAFARRPVLGPEAEPRLRRRAARGRSTARSRPAGRP